jgi:hypothetical protein
MATPATSGSDSITHISLGKHDLIPWHKQFSVALRCWFSSMTGNT